ncbi:hypothetical protein RHMOL_Rhmol01G0227000 [Rhododendron molle]|uniref:Uncharacterized protein n=1 Tax=Rhododendron molle TaxID=49168 RepID=A0ACC0Q5P0_RHOML|nr:hypothetical protein RHMOL_Rhmol01G0227000 [Rhododendron molle]
MTTLIERWWPETHLFHLRTDEWTMTMQDVEVLLGLPVDDEPIIGKSTKEWGPLCQRLLGIVPVPDVDRKNGKSGKQNVGGAFILLQLWAWERFPFVGPGHLGMRERMRSSLLGAWQPPHGKDWKARQKDYRKDHRAKLKMWNNRLDHNMTLFERLRTVQTMEDIDLDELRSIGKERVGAMEYLEKLVLKRKQTLDGDDGGNYDAPDEVTQLGDDLVGMVVTPRWRGM